MASLHSQYEAAKTQAKLRGLEYENKMLLDLISVLLQQTHVGSTSNSSHVGVEPKPSKKREPRTSALPPAEIKQEIKQEPEQEFGAVIFSRGDFEAVNDADEYYAEEYGEGYEEEEDPYGYYDEEGNYHYYEVEDEYYEENVDHETVEQKLGDDGILEAFSSAIAGSLDAEGLEIREMKKRRKQEKVELDVDYKREREEMEVLYGDRAEEVLMAEAEMQLRFDKLCDRNNPMTWPCVPLNFKFTS